MDIASLNSKLIDKLHRNCFPFRRSCLLLVLSMLFMKLLIGHAETTALQQKPYIVYMGERPREFNGHPVLVHSQLLQKAIGLSNEEASKRMIYSYSKSFNAFAAMLSDEEAKKLSGMEELVSVFPSKQRQLHTTRSWNFMGFPTSAPHGPFESDVIVGMIDTGIWPESQSFDDAVFGPPPSKWKGTCQSNHNFTCNNKIIGARYYHLQGNISKNEIPSPRDSEGHGTHTSSTAAGRLVANASLAGIAEGTARGGVPSARIAVYKVCWSDGCSDANLLAAFEDAIADGVDIISVSIGGGGDYFKDPIAIGSFHAMKNNILTSSSAGNSGPGNSSVGNYAPWLLTVAASTIDRKIVAQTKLGNGVEFKGMTVNTYGLDGAMYPLILGENAPNMSAGADPFLASYCGVGKLDSKLVKGKIVICSGLVDGLGAQLAGAVGAIMPAMGANDFSLEFSLPVSVLGPNGTKQVLNYANKTSNATASISKSQAVFDAAAPYVASFSSRGPNPITPNILKPDLTAPGVDILAAWSPLGVEKLGVPYNIISGTSMACPHATGAAAYVKSFNPTWSSAAVRSALITTAYVMSSTKNADAEFAYGAGHINPLAALNPGLVYDAQEIDYIKMLCGEGFSTKKLRLVTGDQSSCTSTNHGTVFDLNYPSFALKTQQGKSFSTSFQRTVTNVGVPNSTYKAIVNAPPSLKVSVDPNVLSFHVLLEKKSFSIKLEGNAPKTIISATLIWSDGAHDVRSPIVVYSY